MRRFFSSVVVVGLIAIGFVTSGVGAKAHTGHTVRIDDVSVTEGGNAVFTLTLSPPADGPERVNVTAATAVGSATSGDYVHKSQSFTFEECSGFCFGASLKFFSVTTNEDSVVEGNEAYVVNLSNVSTTCFLCSSSASIADGQGAGTIVDDDTNPNPNPNPPNPNPEPNPNPSQPRVSIADDADATKRSDCVHGVTLSSSGTSPVTVSYDVISDSFEQIGGQHSGTVTFAPGDTFEEIRLDVAKQSRRFGEVTVQLSNVQGATIDDGVAICSIKAKRRHRR